jgi:hypothetical protein
VVGVVPENVNTAHLHTAGAIAGIGIGQLGVLILGLVLRAIPDWLREFMLVTSLIVLLAGISIVGNRHFGVGAGTLERAAQYPESVWLILFGVYISRDHFRTHVIGRHFTFSESHRDAERRTLTGAFRASRRPATDDIPPASSTPRVP